MKIAFLLRAVILTGGIERVFIDKANWLAERGHSVMLITYEQGSHPMSFSLNPKVKHIDTDCRYHTVYKHNILLRPIFKYKMKQQFRRKLYALITDYHLDVLVIPHNIEEYQTIIASMSSVISIVFESHSASVEVAKIGSFKEILNNIRLFRCIKKFKLVIALTEGDSLFWKHHSNNVRKVSNPLSYYPEEMEYIQKEEGRILYVGRLHPVKRIDRLIQAFAMIADKYPLWHIDIFGEGEEFSKIRHMINDYRLNDRILIHKPVSSIFEEYQRSQFLVLSSDSESFSLVIVEAMAWGLPVVSTACPFGPREIVENGKTGLLSSLEAKDLAKKMEWMITHNAERQNMGVLAHQAASKYKRNIVMEDWEKTYLSTI